MWTPRQRGIICINFQRAWIMYSRGCKKLYSKCAWDASELFSSSERVILGIRRTILFSFHRPKMFFATYKNPVIWKIWATEWTAARREISRGVCAPERDVCFVFQARGRFEERRIFSKFLLHFSGIGENWKVQTYHVLNTINSRCSPVATDTWPLKIGRLPLAMRSRPKKYIQSKQAE